MKYHLRLAAYGFTITALLAGALNAQTIVYVDDDAPLAGNGTSWTTAFRYLQDALAASPINAEIHIAGGLQRPDLGTGIVQYNWDASFKPKSGMVLKGGYRGLAAGGSADDRDLVAFPTVISGDLLSNDPNSYFDNSYHLFEVTGPITSVVFDGMAWHGGRATGPTQVDQRGGGIRQINGSLSLNDVRIDECIGTGGAINFGGGTLTLMGCDFVACAGEGAGVRMNGFTAVIDSCSFFECGGPGVIYAPGASITIRQSHFEITSGALGTALYSLASSVLIEDSEFIGFTASTEGAAAFLRDSITVIRRSVFRDNHSSSPGGAILAWFGTLEIEDSSFDNNQAYSGGGGLLARYPDPLIVRRCQFLNNRAPGGYGGGLSAAQVGSGFTLIEDCTIANNESSYGAGLAVSASGSVSRCVIVNNLGHFAGAGIQIVQNQGQNLVVDHCTISGNGPGSAVQTNSPWGAQELRNTIVWGNSASSALENAAGSLSVAYCDVQNLPALYSGFGNFDLNPQFEAPAQQNFHLLGTSPCIDTGDPVAPLDSDNTRSDMGALFHDQRPSAYCTSSLTSHGCTPSMGWLGIPHVGATSGFVLSCSGLDGQRNGLFFYGTASTSLAWAIGSTSYKCVASPVQRMTMQNSLGTAGQCNGAFAEDWSAYCAGHPSAIGLPFSVGQHFYAQAWFRDPPAPKSTNLSDAVSFVVLP